MNSGTAPCCRLTTAEDALVSCLQPGPLACQCIQQCTALMCGLLNNGTSECALRIERVDRGCWHWLTRPADQQLSDVPDASDRGVTYWTSFEWVLRAHGCPFDGSVLAACLTQRYYVARYYVAPVMNSAAPCWRTTAGLGSSSWGDRPALSPPGKQLRGPHTRQQTSAWPTCPGRPCQTSTPRRPPTRCPCRGARTPAITAAPAGTTRDPARHPVQSR
jgi:hypothetical protein